MILGSNGIKTFRAPFGLFYHAAWFTHEHHKEGFIAFMDTIVNMPEVWLVTNWQALQWVRDPQPLNTVNNFPAFQCNEVSTYFFRYYLLENLIFLACKCHSFSGSEQDPCVVVGMLFYLPQKVWFMR